MHGVIVWRRWAVGEDGKSGAAAKIDEGTCTRACFGLAQVGGVGVCPEVHFAGVVGNGGVWVCRRLVKEVSDAVLDVRKGGSAVGCGDGADGRQHSGVDSPSVI